MDLIALTKITFRIYLDVFVLSLKQVLISWRMIGFHFLLLLAVGLFGNIIGIIFDPSSLAGSFIRGMLASYVLSVYLASVKAIIEKDKINYKNLFNEGLQIFSPLISVFFALMLINFLLKGINSPFLSLAFGILFSVLANPLPEIIYLRGGMLGQLIQDSFEFVRDNFFEWFAPAVFIIIIVFSASPRALVGAFQQNPLQIIETSLIIISLAILNISLWFFFVLLLFLFLFLMLLRGNLYLALEKGRRSRLYKGKL